MPSGDREGYSSIEVCDATGLRRTTLDAWVLRRYLDLSEGPGTGRERRFSFNEVVLIAIAAELTKLGLTVGATAHATKEAAGPAAHAANILIRAGDVGERALHEDGWTLIITPSIAPPGIEAPPDRSGYALIKAKTLRDMQIFIREKHSDPAAVVIADVSAIARRTAGRLGRATPPTRKGRPRKA